VILREQLLEAVDIRHDLSLDGALQEREEEPEREGASA
jgi:hypothetical protein